MTSHNFGQGLSTFVTKSLTPSPPKNVTSFFDDPFSILHFRWAVFLLVLILKRFSYASLLVKLDFNKIQLDKTEFNNCEDGTRSRE